MSPTYKSPQISHTGVDHDNGYGQDAHELHDFYKTSEADRRDMLRMNKPQEMRVCMAERAIKLGVTDIPALA